MHKASTNQAIKPKLNEVNNRLNLNHDYFSIGCFNFLSCTAAVNIAVIEHSGNAIIIMSFQNIQVLSEMESLCLLCI